MHTCTSSLTDEVVYRLRNGRKRHSPDPGLLYVGLQSLSLTTLSAIRAALMRSDDEASDTIASLVRHYLRAKSEQERGRRESIVYYGSRLYATLQAFLPNTRSFSAKVLEVAASLADTALWFRGIDDKLFRSGSYSAERDMRARAAWFCLGREKMMDAETLHYMSDNLELLAPHVPEIRKRKFYDTGILKMIMADAEPHPHNKVDREG